ncbi:MAG: AI-2E family transporter [Defluviitaleaceae bacterium]|nr:AI-2E family transporter [Defluviitaleaceae bacterium]
MNKTQILEKFKTLLPYFLLALAVIIAYRVSGALDVFGNFLGNVWAVISPFFFGFVIAYIINIPCGSIQKLLARSKSRFILKKQRMLSVLIVMIIIMGLIALALSIVIPAIVNSISLFIYNFDTYWENVLGVFDWFYDLGWFADIEMSAIFGALTGMLANISLDDLAQPINAILGLGNTLFGVVIAIISAIYVLIEKDRIKALVSKMLTVFSSKKFMIAANEVGGRLNKYFRQYIRAQTIDGIILGTMATIALTIMGSPFALVLGVMLGIVNYIPFFGSLFGTIFTVVVVIFTQDFTMGLIAALVLFVIQQIDANIIQPRLMSGSFSMSPLLVIISITVGGAIAGVMGMLAAIPIAALLKDVFEEVMEHYSRKKFGMPDDEGGS